MSNLKDYSFRYKNEIIHLIDPESRYDLYDAIIVLRKLSELSADEDQGERFDESYLAMQKQMIIDYVNSLGDINYDLLSENISYLSKEHGIKITELEKALNKSQGYVSRTLNSNAKQTMNLSLAWKIAQILDADLNTMLTVDLQNRRGNSSMLVRFMKKLEVQTREGNVTWYSGGGFNTPLDPDLEDSKIVVYRENDGGLEAFYDKEGGEYGPHYPLTDEVMILRNFIGPNKDLYIIPYEEPGQIVEESYDFWIHDKEITRKPEDEYPVDWKEFYTYDDIIDEEVALAAKKLYSTTRHMQYDAHMRPEYKSFIKDFLNE